MTTRPYRAFQGRNDIERASAYLLSTEPAFKTLSRYEQIRKAGELVRMSEGGKLDEVNEASKEEAAAADGKKGKALDALSAAIEQLDPLLTAAIDEDAEATGRAIESLAQRALARRAAKGGSGGIVASYAAYPGRNDIEQADAFLGHTLSGFRTRDRLQRLRLASEYVRTFNSSGAAEADRVLMSRLGAV